MTVAEQFSVEKPAKRLGVFPVLESLRTTSHTQSIVCSSFSPCGHTWERTLGNGSRSRTCLTMVRDFGLAMGMSCR